MAEQKGPYVFGIDAQGKIQRHSISQLLKPTVKSPITGICCRLPFKEDTLCGTQLTLTPELKL